MGDFKGVYLDASVIIRQTFGHSGALSGRRFESAISSELVVLEVKRTIANRQLIEPMSPEALLEAQGIAEKGLAAPQILPMDRIVIRRAMSAFPTRVGSLDSIHLATALLWAEHIDPGLVLLTHDRQLAIAARACGLSVYPDPV